MAAKGVIVSFIIDPDCHGINDCVDVNARKRACFALLTEHRIKLLDALHNNCRAPKLLVMNTNYLQEIRDYYHPLGLAPEFADVGGRIIQSKDPITI